MQHFQLKQVLKDEKIQALKLRKAVCCSKEMTFKEVSQEMKRNKQGCALIVERENEGEGSKIIGIFTERDALTRVVGQALSASTPIEKIMTREPKVLRMEDSVAEAVRLMNTGGYRHIPLVDSQGEAKGVVSVRDILTYLAEHFPYEVYNLPPNPRQVIRAPEGA